MKKLLGCLVLVMAACGGKTATTTTTTETTTTTSTTDSTAKPLLTITELTFAQGDDVGMKLHANGDVEGKGKRSEGGKPAVEEWKTFAKLTSDGKVMHDGKVGAELKADGSLVMANGDVAPFKIEVNALTIGDKKITIDDKGMILGGRPDAPAMHVTGVTDDGSRRAALLILALMFSGNPTAGSATASPATIK